MIMFHLALLALIQGVTEFLPVSSSGHLALLPLLSDMPDQGLGIDIAAHAGSLLAILIYFWRDSFRLFQGFADIIQRNRNSADSRLFLCLVGATIPVVIAGAIIKFIGLDVHLRKIEIIGLATLLFGIVLYFADRLNSETKIASEWNGKDALILGLWQVIALIPGASRAGVTITAARLCGYKRRDAAKLSMLMSIPVISAASLLTIVEMMATGNSIVLQEAFIVAILSFIAAITAVSLMMEMLKRFRFTPFVIYRLFLGVGLLAFAFF